MRIRTLLLAILACSLALGAWAPAASAQSGFIPVANQSINLGSQGIGSLTGVKITSIKQVNGTLRANGLAYVNSSAGTLVGTFINAPLAATSTAVSSAAAVAPAAKICPILNLRIGPIHLNLLGLVVNVPNPIVVNITAVEAPGNLLGNLLCAVANLLNTVPPPLDQIVPLLQQIISQL
jgi:hypothetical protein